MARLNLAKRLQKMLERWRFRSLRADYYQYLASLLKDAQGHFTLRDVFLRDSIRYGDHLRGQLSSQWLHIYQRHGGDLYTTWQHHFPHAELSLIRSAQTLGNEAVIQTLSQFSTVLELTGQARRVLVGILWPALVALALGFVMTLMVPMFTVPRLLGTFGSIPPEHYGRLTRHLVRFANITEALWPGILLAVLITSLILGWSLAHLTGRLRQWLDSLLWWDSYRQVVALKWALFLRISLGDGDQSVTRLRQALLYQWSGAKPWIRWHINLMLRRLDDGLHGAAVFDTGMLAKAHYWFFADMFEARHLNAALRLLAQRIHGDILGSLARRAQAFRWLLLLSCVSYLLGLALWHYAVIDELRRALSLQFSDF